MSTETYDPIEDLSATERELLKAAAVKDGMKPAEFIEATLKRRLWADRPLNAPIPRPQLNTRRRTGTH